MQTLTNFEYKGKRMKIGALCFDEKDRLYIFVTYCDNCRGKIVITREEAQFFCKKYTYEKNKLRTRIVNKIFSQY